MTRPGLAERPVRLHRINQEKRVLTARHRKGESVDIGDLAMMAQPLCLGSQQAVKLGRGVA